MKKTNKLISILLVMAMLLSMAPLSLTASAASPTPYDGVPVTPMEIHGGNYKFLGLTDDNWLQYEGYYAIRNAKELYGYAELVKDIYSTYYSYDAVLLQDIVVNTPGSTTYKWTPIVTGSDYFWDVFDGNGHSISGLYCTDVMDSGMYYYSFTSFIAFLDGGTVKNLVIKDSTFSSDALQVAGITALNFGTVENCRVESSVTVSSSNTGVNYSYAGGIVGENGGSVANCVSYASVSGGYSNGALIGGGNAASNSYSSASSHNCANISVTHQRINATCYYPGRSYYSFCLVCDSVTSGTKIDTDVAGHKWGEATCTEPQYCEVCDKSNGTPNGHKNLRYIADAATGRHAEYLCDVCGTVGTVTLSSQHVDYDGNPHGATVTYTGNFPKVTVNYKNRATGAISTEAPTEAGTYDAYFAVGAFRLTSTYIINKRVIDDITAPTPNTLIYNGEAQALVSAGEANGGEIRYSLDGVTYSADIPVATNAGDYIVYYKVIGDNNHKDTEPATVSVTIGKKPVTITATDASKTYGEEDPESFAYSYNLSYPQYKLNGEPSRTPGENVGVYEIGQGTLTNENNPNFDITFISGKFTIEPDKSGIDGITPLNVKSSDRAKIEYVYNQLENAVTDLADADKRAEWDNLKSDCVEMLAVISDTTDEIDRIVNAVNDYDINTVTGDDVRDLLDILDDANALLETDNLTSEQTETLNQAVKDIQRLISIYDRVSAQIGDIKERMNRYDEATVKSSDKADIEQLKADIKKLTDGQNLTADEREYLINSDAECDKFLAKIAETKSEYDRVIAAANGYDKATVTSADRDALDKLRIDAYMLSDTDNVTPEEKENLQIVFENLTGMVETLINVDNEIERIISAVGGYDEATVKYSDYKDILQLIDDIEALTDGQNITEDERANLEELNTKANLLAAKIRSTADEIARITRAVNAYNIDTVKSSDKAAIENLIARIKKLTDGDNITADEREQLVANDENLDALLAKINATADEIARIEEAVNSYDEATVKSTDKADLEQLVEDIKALTDATNITEDERTKLGELDTTVDSLIKKIDDTAAEIKRIDEAVNSYDKETVTSDDVPALGKLIEDIKAITDGDNITEDEKAALEANDEAIDELIEKLAEVAEEIKRVDEAVKSYDEDTVKSSDSEELAKLKEDVQALIDSTNTTENEKTTLEEMIKDIEGLEGKIEEIEQQLEEIAGIESSYNPETVTSDDKATIEETIAEIEAVNPDNLTDEQKAEYEEIKAEFEALLDEIAAAGAEVDAIGGELEMFDEKRVTIFWEDDIEALKAKIDELLADENMGEAEKTKLNEHNTQADNLIEIINNPWKYFSLRLFYFIWDCILWKYNGILNLF